jgi:hypothetical protein
LNLSAIKFACGSSRLSFIDGMRLPPSIALSGG